MATISENLSKIQTAVYGREVRTAIHDSIRQCYNDTQTFSQTANAAITSAEGAATRANTAAGSAETKASAASSAASRANTAAAAAEAAVDLINNAEGIISVNGHQGVVNLTASDVGALPSGTTAADIGALPSSSTAADLGGVTSVNGIEPDASGSLTITESNISGVPIFVAGSAATDSIADNAVGNKTVTFETAFPEGYSVFVFPFFSLGSARFALCEAIATSVTKTGFNLRVANKSGSAIAKDTSVNYFAIGYKQD